MNHSATTATHAAHVATSCDLAQDGDTKATGPQERDTAQPSDSSPVKQGSRQGLTTVTYPRPRCPQCGHVHLRKYRSLSDQGDGSALSWVECQNTSCGHRFRLVLE